MTARELEIHTELSFRENIAYLGRIGLKIDPKCVGQLRQEIENEVMKEMIAGGEESGHFLSLVQYLPDSGSTSSYEYGGSDLTVAAARFDTRRRENFTLQGGQI